MKYYIKAVLEIKNDFCEVPKEDYDKFESTMTNNGWINSGEYMDGDYSVRRFDKDYYPSFLLATKGEAA